MRIKSLQLKFSSCYKDRYLHLTGQISHHKLDLVLQLLEQRGFYAEKNSAISQEFPLRIQLINKLFDFNLLVPYSYINKTSMVEAKHVLELNKILEKYGLESLYK